MAPMPAKVSGARLISPAYPVSSTTESPTTARASASPKINCQFGASRWARASTVPTKASPQPAQARAGGTGARCPAPRSPATEASPAAEASPVVPTDEAAMRRLGSTSRMAKSMRMGMVDRKLDSQTQSLPISALSQDQ